MKSRGTAAAAAVFRDTDTLDRIEDTLGGKKMRTMDVIRRIIDQHLWPHKKVLAVSFAAMLVVAATTAGIPFLIQLAADELAIAGNEQMIVLIPLLTIAIMTTKAVAEYISAVGQGFVGERLVADLRHDLFDALARADIAWLQNTHSGRFVASFMTDINAIRDASGVGLVALAGNLLKVIFLFGAMVYMDWLLSLFALAILPIAVRLMGRQRKKMFRSTSQMFQETGDLSSLISQALSGMRVVRAYGQEQAESARVQAVAERTYRFMMQSIRVKAATGPIVEALTGIGFAAAIFYSGYRGMAGTLTPGEFIGFMTAAMLMYQPLRAFATLQTVLQTGVAAASRVYGVIDTERQVTDRADAVELDVPTGEIVFDKVSFAYREDAPVLNDFDLTVAPGSRVALVGPSGAGKSTVMNLLLRFYDPVSGRILIDGQNIAHARIDSVRHHIALVTQEPFLFDDTVRANIAYGTEGASDADIEAAAKAAVAHDFIAELPGSYDYQVGERGMNLSGGQKQRIAFARAMLRKAPIVLLDEPTSSLDSDAEAQLQEALEHVIEGRTVIMIAHRLSTIRQADLICVMQDGRIVERGRHADLIEHSGLYARLWRAQAGEMITDGPALVD